MEKLGIAIIGTGFIGPVHAEAIRRNPELAELRAIAGVSEEDAAAAAARLNIPCHTGNYKDIFAMNDIDVVHICTPNFLHYPMVKECLEKREKRYMRETPGSDFPAGTRTETAGRRKTAQRRGKL